MLLGKSMLVIALLCALPSLGHGEPVRGVEEVLAVLERAKSDPPPQAAELGKELARLGPALLPDLFAVLAGVAPPERELSALEESALTEALVSFRAPPLRAFFERRLASDPTTEECCAILGLLGRVGSTQDLALVRKCAEAPPPDANVGRPLEGAITGILARDAHGCQSLRRWVLQSSPEIGAALVRGLGQSARAEALPVLCELLDEHGVLAAVLLPEIGRLARTAPRPIPVDQLEPVRVALLSEDPQVAREAALAIGRAEDSLAAASLIELLEHENRGTREAASWALKELTGLSFRGDARRWRSWLADESRWFEDESPLLFQKLRAGPEAISVRALGIVRQHRLHRHELALGVVGALGHRSPRVRALACTVLERVGSSAAIPGLLAALEAEQDEAVIHDARQALEVLGARAPAALDGERSSSLPSAAQGSRSNGRETDGSQS